MSSSKLTDTTIYGGVVWEKAHGLKMSSWIHLKKNIFAVWFQCQLCHLLQRLLLWQILAKRASLVHYTWWAQRRPWPCLEQQQRGSTERGVTGHANGTSMVECIARITANPYKPTVPILLANVCSLDSKMDYISRPPSVLVTRWHTADVNIKLKYALSLWMHFVALRC